MAENFVDVSKLLFEDLNLLSFNSIDGLSRVGIRKKFIRAMNI